jgi:hypothetical protein
VSEDLSSGQEHPLLSPSKSVHESVYSVPISLEIFFDICRLSRILQPFHFPSDFAARTECAVLISTHFACLSRSRVSPSSVKRNYKAPASTYLHHFTRKVLTLLSFLRSEIVFLFGIKQQKKILLFYVLLLRCLVRSRKDRIF